MGLSGGRVCGPDLALPGAAKSSSVGRPLACPLGRGGAADRDPFPLACPLDRGGAGGVPPGEFCGRPVASARNPVKKLTTRYVSCLANASLSRSWRLIPE